MLYKYERGEHLDIFIDLIDHRKFDICVHHLLQVPDAEVADTYATYHPFVLGFENSLPTFTTLLWAADGRVHEVQIDVPQPGLLERATDRSFRR